MIRSFVLERLRSIAPTMRAYKLPRARLALHAMPTTCGCETRTGPGYDWDGRKRGQKPFTVLQHTLSGAGWLRFEGERRRVVAGDTLILSVPHDHRYWIEAGGRWEFFWISMHGLEALRIHRAAIALNGPVQRFDARTVERLALACLRLVEIEDATPGIVSTIAYEAMMALHDAVSGVQGPAPGRFGRALAKVREPATPKPSVEEMAAATGITRAHFTRVFAAEVGETPGRYARASRLKRAAELLEADPRTTVKRAAAVAGYADAGQFSTAFRGVYGVPPRTYRDRAAGAAKPAESLRRPARRGTPA